MQFIRKSVPKVYIALIFAFIYLPMLLVVAYSFNSSENDAVWAGFTLKWYADMANDGKLMASFIISLQVAGASALLSAVIGTVGAVSCRELGKKTAVLLSGLIYIPIIVPEIILGSAYLLFFSVLPFGYSRTSLVLAHSSFCIPYVFILVGIRLKSVEKSVVEAARDLGASKLKVFTTITFPLTLPAILSGMLLSVAMSLDDVVISFFVSGPTSTTLPMKIYSMIRLGVTPKINALCTVILLVTFSVAGILRATAFDKKSNKEKS